MVDRSHWRDQQEKASGVLEDVLDAEAGVDIDAIASQSAVETELQKQSFLKPEDSGRVRSRVLYITEDESLLNEPSKNRDFLLSVAEDFEEMHIIVTVPLRRSKKKSERIGPNVWLYTTGHPEWWRVPGILKSIAAEQLSFGGGFRPDLIVVTNPFEAALGAYWLAEKYQRTLQVHVASPYWGDAFKKADKPNRWRTHIAKYVLKRTKSIVAGTNDLQTYLKQKFSEATVTLLPRYHNLQGLLEIAKHSNAQQLFTQYTLRLLYVGPLNQGSTLFRAIDAARLVLQNKNIALIVVGEGPQKAEFANRAKILGIDTQVIFKPATNDLLPYFSSADIMLITDTTEASDELVIQAAATGTPMVMATTALRNELFEDAKDAFLCEPTDTVEFTQKLNKLVGDSALRLQFRERSKFMATNRLNESPENFRAAYVAALESAFAADHD